MPTLFPISLLVRQGDGLTLEFKEHFTPRITEEEYACP